VNNVAAREQACERGVTTEGTLSWIDVQDEERLAIMKCALYILFFIDKEEVRWRKRLNRTRHGLE
jgi:hypothetical protein